MRPTKRLVLLVTVTLMMLSLFAGPVHAHGDDNDDASLMVSIESADYLALDADQIENDIITEFTITLPDGEWSFGMTYIYCEIELPSGLTFYCEIVAIGSYNTLGLVLGWHNTAIETGWYTFRVFARVYGNHVPDSGYDSFAFDPPTDGDPAPPVIEIIEVIIE
ncbi:MAG: hypothetical protein ACFFE2_11940 [Candidatus Thorarchaeota archaeon]